jgi:copper transport protein
MRLALQELPKDSYTAIWRVRSAVDGHITESSIPFGVGVAAISGSLIPAPDAPDPATAPPPPLDSLARWLSLLSAAIAFGGLPFGLLVWRPAFKRWSVAAGPAPIAADARMTWAIRRLILAGVGLFLLASLLFLVVQAAAAAGVPIAQAIGTPIVQLLGGRSGLVWLARVVLALVAAAIAWRLPPAGQGPAWPWWCGLLIAGGTLLTFSLNSHGAAMGHDLLLSVALDWLHIAAMVAWLGGLIPLALAVRVARRDPDHALPLALLIPRFSRLSAPCLALLTLTGIYAYVQHINGLDLLAATTYGRALAVKLGLFGILLLLGGLNLFVFEPQLRSAGNRMARAFGRSVPAELLVGALVLLAVGVMTSVAPSQVAWQEHQQLGLMQEAKVDNVDLVLRVAPATIGDNEFAVDVTDQRPGAAAAPSKMLLHFNMLGMEMGQVQTEARATDTQRYTTRGSFVNMGGRWNIEVVLRRAGFDDVRHTFQLDIVRSAALAP